MENLPTKSESSFKKGIWLIYRNDDDIITLWGSAINGKEKFFLNNELIVQTRRVRLKSNHTIIGSKGSLYEINFSVKNSLNGDLECEITKDGNVVKIFRVSYQKGFKLTIKRMLPFFILGITYAILSRKYPVSIWYLFLSFALIMVFSFLPVVRGNFIIEESEII